MATPEYKRPGFDTPKTTAEIDADITRLHKEQTILKLRDYIRKEQLRLLRNRERLHADGLAINAAWGRKL